MAAVADERGTADRHLNPKPLLWIVQERRRATCMCQSCIDIDKQVEHFRELLRSLTDLAEIERITQLIAKLYADRVRLHQNPE
jgi:vacuolar-type H+-ATPase subunit D/Vma8